MLMVFIIIIIVCVLGLKWAYMYMQLHVNSKATYIHMSTSSQQKPVGTPDHNIGAPARPPAESSNLTVHLPTQYM